ncbi:helix-turn-helix domain-containing protein [Enterococcus faecalis]|uniref:helix-turn-helix domain-containing protein n=1 Tax=Enterococcus faecalis TaxID=1351 RepID=UPI0013620781|nr:helix-turn-helix domain-containing protein [Enterococcus faecalis]
MTSDQLASALNCEKKTIHKYTKDLMKEIEFLDQENLTLEIIKGKGLKLFIKSQYTYSLFRQNIMKKTITVDCLMSIFFQKKNSLLSLSEKNFISESTTRRKLTQLKNMLSEYEIDLIGKQGKFYMVGVEKNIRLYMYNSIWEIFETKNWPFFSIDINKIKTFIDNVFEEKRIYLNEITKHRLSLFIGVCIIRYRQGFKIKEIGINNSYSPYFTSSRTYCYFEQRLQEDLYLPAMEAKYIYFFIISQLGIHGELNKIADLQELHKYSNSFSYKSSIFIINHIETQYKTLEEQERKELLTKLLCIHMFIYIFPNFTKDNSGDPVISKIKKELPNLVDEARIIIKSIPIKSKKVLLVNNNYLTDQLTQILYSLGLGTSFEEKVSVYLETGLVSTSEDILKEQIIHSCGKQYNIEFLSFKNYEGENNPLYIDVLIVTHITDTILKKYKFKEIVHIHPSITLKDINNLHESLKRITNI